MKMMERIFCEPEFLRVSPSATPFAKALPGVERPGHKYISRKFAKALPGVERPGHKYISRKKVNGRWEYVYAGAGAGALEAEAAAHERQAASVRERISMAVAQFRRHHEAGRAKEAADALAGRDALVEQWKRHKSDAKNALDARYKKPIVLTEEQKAAIGQYISLQGESINKEVEASGAPGQRPHYRETIQELKTAIASAVTAVPMHLFRGATVDKLPKAGGTMETARFLSGTNNEKVARMFTQIHNEKKTPVIYDIELPAGVAVLDFNHARDSENEEHEFLFAPGQKFTVKAVTKGGANTHARVALVAEKQPEQTPGPEGRPAAPRTPVQ